VSIPSAGMDRGDVEKLGRPGGSGGTSAKEAPALLDALLDRYASGGEPTRAAIRALLQEHRYFAWAVRLEPAPMSAREFRRQLIHVSALDQERDTREGHGVDAGHPVAPGRLRARPGVRQSRGSATASTASRERAADPRGVRSGTGR
jgi:hypothetical protein